MTAEAGFCPTCGGVTDARRVDPEERCACAPPAEPRWFTWVVEFQVHEIWVRDGFSLGDQRALTMLATDLGWASIDQELRARVLHAPPWRAVAAEQGYGPEESPEPRLIETPAALTPAELREISAWLCATSEPGDRERALAARCREVATHLGQP